MIKRTDDNQAGIVAALRQLGCSVFVLSDVGRGLADILVGKDDKNYLFEIKNPCGRGKRYTRDQCKFMETWRGKVATITSLDEALEYLDLAAS